MRLACENLEMNISQYNQQGFEHNREVILQILQKTFLMLLEDREEGEITETFLYNSLKKLIKFIEVNGLKDSRQLHYKDIKKELDKLIAPIAENIN